MEDRGPIVVQVVGYKKTGKTTLVCRLVEHFSSIGLRVAVIKHDAHDFEPDVPGTDSWKHRHAGAHWTAVVSPGRTAFFEERGTELEELLLRMKEADLILVEGFKRKAYPKLVLIQSEEHLSILDELESVMAVITWVERETEDWADRIESERGIPLIRYENTHGMLKLLQTKLQRLNEMNRR